MIKRKSRLLFVGLGALAIGGFALARYQNFKTAPIDSEPDVTSSIRVGGGDTRKPIPKGGGNYRVGDPYVIAGRTYIPREDPNYRAEGVASWYGEPFHGRLTANGEKFDMHALSAAHPTLPLPSYARVTNLENNLSLVVRLNDRGPYHENRLIDLSVKAAKLLAFHDQGLTRVRVEYLGRAELEGSDDRKLAATLRREAPSESDVVGSTRRTAALNQIGAAMEPIIGSDAYNVGNDRPRAPDAGASDAIEDRFPKVIFD